MIFTNTAENSPLGKPSSYQTQYQPTLLFPIARQRTRQEIGIDDSKLPFFGYDIWNAYEVSWLNLRGKPQVTIATFTVPADSPNIIESKSFKLYLNSFNQTQLANADALLALLHQDISREFGAPVKITLTPCLGNDTQLQTLPGILLDRLDIEVNEYHPNPMLLFSDPTQAIVEETLVSHLLKSNCLVTGQPDWGSIQIHYVGPPIDQAGLLKYLISFRDHHEFHEQCVERIFMDLMRTCAPHKLSVYARYTRRGGLDINPWRSNFSTATPPLNMRQIRQ